jgi:subtilisin family serine protease
VLCGIAPVVDDVLRCIGTTQGASAGNGSPGSMFSAAGTLQEQPPRRIPAGPRFAPDLLLVRFRRGTSRPQQVQALVRAGVVAERRIAELGVVVVRMAPRHREAALIDLRASRSVANAEKDALFEGLATTPNDTNWAAQWGLRRVGLPSAWDRTRGAGNLVVAVLDTGVDAGHPDLSGAILPGSNLVDLAAGPVDDNGHGTAVAGIIAARTDNHLGIAGICWTCSILPIKVLGADGTGDTGQVAAGIVRAAAAGARVISMSLGGPADDQTLDDAISYAAGKGAILVAAAGNNGTSAPFYPAANPDVIGVAATNESDHVYPWSNFGPWVQIAAPGCNAAPNLAGGYILFCGTSSAAPVVAGLVALQLSEQPNASRKEILDAIEGSAAPIGDVVHRGRIDAPAALSVLAPSPAPPKTDTTSTLTVNAFLTRRSSTRVYRCPAGGGVLTATVTFNGASTLTLSVRGQAGGLVGQSAGESPVRLSRQVPAGPCSVAVSSRKAKAAFRLVLSLDSTR